jgi:hypothetical protein
MASHLTKANTAPSYFGETEASLFPRRRCRVLLVALLYLLLPALVPVTSVSQTVNGSFRGTVSDQSGAAIPGAHVQAVNAATGVPREATTDAGGAYELSNMPPANYDFSVSFVGFATAVNRGVTLLVNQNVTLDFRLSPGTVRQEVTVTAQASLANLTNATVGTVVESEKVAQLPLNGRQFTGLILLTPGVAPMAGGQHLVYELHTEMGAISPSVNGMQSTMNNFTIDGVENNELFLNFAAIIPPPDAIQEFAVQTNMSSGEYGRGGGANVNVVTKSGSNEFHGDA